MITNLTASHLLEFHGYSIHSHKQDKLYSMERLTGHSCIHYINSWISILEWLRNIVITQLCPYREA